MNTLRQEFCDETNTPMGLDNEFDYIRWLEAKIQALRIHDVVGSCHCSRCGDKHHDCLNGKMCYVCDNVTQGN